ncbi:type II toxin-antitoxin system RelE/ParE family toxin [Tardiphaga sp. vice352]|uniref:type II toxin-antitoxin system RelE/ParE family toxin n=1 Tax=unclassified Tardiphaga TaxID=2631404 RepID=UPI00116483D5|nr:MULTISPECIES: type II toxin-antitoxin system RelE/ParE family toxin [unclassified Tardiphaga]QDM18441.1 type II toxin-antitoxin system RelE/ParE family toxin [Tardiphaga sp. vice278]QDM23442.1 type II toxin-antitoxin system RelE/ParE family toxin [Tardiphaga sp. vice154]QDM28664.1 type II toxin-antitoxin system RelE/ParE family toxin [Tardiphaga sp. vice304]QDM33765.1 type II toxin-antitoxin system RelE/ParE family toxin [Tardiphaga sp. vice352]
MRLRYTRRALADLDGILDYIASQSPQGATRVHARIQRMVSLLPSHPAIGSRTEDPTIRKLATPPYPYLIFYEPTEKEVIVHAIRHAARNPSDTPGSG